MSGGAHARRQTVPVNGVDLFLRATGDPKAPLRPVPARFSRILGRLGRGAAGASRRSSMPSHLTSAAMPARPSPRGSRPIASKHLVRDVLALGDRLSPERPFELVGHDWGASVAYATAIAAPAAHRQAGGDQWGAPRAVPARADRGRGPAQGQRLHARPARSRAPRKGCPPTVSRSCSPCSAGSARSRGLRPRSRQRYIEAWSPPGALTGMLNWYRASPLLVPHPGETVDPGKVMKLDPGPAASAHAAPGDLGHGRPRAAAGVPGHA